MTYPLALTVDGVAYSLAVDGGRTLLAALRDDVGVTGAKEGCDDSECGACMVLLDGRPVNSCSFLALQANGREVTTVEGLSDGAEPSPLQRAFVRTGGIQCGFCTPGMLLTVSSLLEHGELSADEEQIKRRLDGNICRCTGYRGIVEAVADLAAR